MSTYRENLAGFCSGIVVGLMVYPEAVEYVGTLAVVLLQGALAVVALYLFYSEE